MENLGEDFWTEILGRLSSTERDLVPCMSVCKLWNRITSDLWVRRFWEKSPPLGIYYLTIQAPTPTPLCLSMMKKKPSYLPEPPLCLSMMKKKPSYLPQMNYASLYNYLDKIDNYVEATKTVCELFDRPPEYFRIHKRNWQYGRDYRRRDDEAEDCDDYLDGCNGLLLLLKSTTDQFYVCNPITTQQVPVPKACVHQNQNKEQRFCAILAFDPSESPHYYRVVRIDYTSSSTSSSSSCSTMLDIFSSEYGQWVRHKFQLDTEFTEGFEKVECCRKFVYLRDKLYSITMSWKILCIDLKIVDATCTLELPVPEANRTAAMGCLGVSMGLLCYMKRMRSSDGSIHLVVWYYDVCSSESSEWTLKYRVCTFLLAYYIEEAIDPHHYCHSDSEDDIDEDDDDLDEDTMEPCAISPSSDILFFSTPKIICCYNLRSEKFKLVIEPLKRKIVMSGCFWVLRACFVPFYLLGKRNNNNSRVLVTDGVEILATEAAAIDEEKKETVDVINVTLYDHQEKPIPPLVYPSEVMDMYVEFDLPYVNLP